MSVEACAGLVQKGDPDRFACTMTARPEARDALFVLYAFNLEVSRAPWVTQEPMIGEMRLQWWLDAIEEIYAGGPVRRHEVVTPLGDVISAHNLPRDLFNNLIQARQWDIYKEPHADSKALEDYIDATYGGLMQLACLCLGHAPKGISDYAFGGGLAAYLIAIPALEDHGRISMIDGTLEGVKALAQSGLERSMRGHTQIQGMSSDILPALRPARLGAKTLKRAIQSPMSVVDDQLAPSHASRRISMLWSVLTGRL